MDERCALAPVTVTWCGEESVLVQVMVWPLLTTTVSGPNLKSEIETTPGPGAGLATAPSAVPFRPASEITKSCPACGLWQVKQAARLALSLTFLSGPNAWYSHSPLRTSSLYSAPQPSRFSMTV